MKYSHGFKLVLASLVTLTYNLESLTQAVIKSAKRKGRKVVYPCDLKAIDLILESVHDVTGHVFSVQVLNGNVQEAIEMLSNIIKAEDHYIQLLLV